MEGGWLERTRQGLRPAQWRALSSRESCTAQSRQVHREEAQQPGPGNACGVRVSAECGSACVAHVAPVSLAARTRGVDDGVAFGTRDQQGGRTWLGVGLGLGLVLGLLLGLVLGLGQVLGLVLGLV